VRKLGITAVAVIMTLVISAGYKPISLPTEEAAKVGYLAPAFSLEGTDGKTYSVGGRRDKALLINFWASWCGPCKLEAPDLVRLSKQYAEKLDIYAVNAYQTDSENGIEKFIAQYGIEFPILIDQKSEVMKRYRVLGFPTNMLVDRNGVVQEVIMGYYPIEELERKIKQLIESNS